MRYKKTVCILFVICVAVTFLGIASAAEVTILGETFNIPDGFEENKTMEKETLNSDGTTSLRKGYNNGTAGIIITVNSHNGKPKLPTTMPDFTNKTINGVDGIYSEDRDIFHYVNDTLSIDISVYNIDIEEIVIPR